MRRLLIVLVLSLPALPAVGAPQMPQGWYLGAGYGETDIDATTTLFDGQTIDATEDARTYFGGYRAGSVGIEAGRTDFGTFATTSATGTPGRLALEGDSLSVLLNWQLGRSISLFGRWGRIWWQSDLVTGNQTLTTEEAGSYRGIGLRFGVGAGLHLILEQRDFKIQGLEPKLISAGVAWRF